MNEVIGTVLPLALTVAISPVPIIAAILMLLSPRATATSLGFLLGWTLGVVVVVSLFTVLSGLIVPGDQGGSTVAAVIKIVLGVLLVVFAVLQWRKRPRAGETPAMPRWMSAIDSMTVPRALALAFVLAAVNPKNLVMAVTAGVDIGTAGLTIGEDVLVIAIFVLIAISTVAVPVIGHLVAGDRTKPALESMRVWLTKNNAIVMSVLLLVIGVVNIGKGIAAL